MLREMWHFCDSLSASFYVNGYKSARVNAKLDDQYEAHYKTKELTSSIFD